MKTYQCVLFDLDHTLWDYDANCEEALHQLYTKHQLNERGIGTFSLFLTTFLKINTQLWYQYDLGLIGREVIRDQRFHQVLSSLGLEDYPLSLTLSEEYVLLSPTKKKLLPNALPTLQYLKEKYTLVIVTNGFEDIQKVKMTSSGIQSYFKKVITSEQAGHRKPAKEIFEYTLKHGGYLAHEVIMVGDNLLTDIKGARNAFIDTIFFNPSKIPHHEPVSYEISDLLELKQIL